MKYLIKKLKRSHMFQKALLLVCLLFSFNIFFQVNQIKQSEIQSISSYQQFRQQVEKECSLLNESSLFQNEDSKDTILLKKMNENYQQVEVKGSIQKTYQLLFENDKDLLLLVLLMTSMYSCLIIQEKEEGYATYFDVLYQTKQGYYRKLFYFVSIGTLVCFLVMSFIRILVGRMIFHSQALDLPLQVVNGFLKSPYHIMIWQAICAYVVFYVIVLAVLNDIFFVFARKYQTNKSYFSTVVACIVVLFFINKIPFQSKYVFLKLAGWLNFSQHMSSFFYVVVGNRCYSSLLITGFWFIVLIAIASVFHVSRCPISYQSRPNTQSHTKIRSLRVLECKKHLQKSTYFLLVMLMMCNLCLFQTNVEVGMQNRMVNRYFNRLEGFHTDEKDNWIEDKTNQFLCDQEEYDCYVIKQDLTKDEKQRMIDLENNLLQRQPFEFVKDEYEKKYILINTYLCKKVFFYKDVQLYVVLITILVFVLLHDMKYYDQTQKLERYFYSIDQYRSKTSSMDMKIAFVVCFLQVLLICIYLMKEAYVFEKAPSIFLKGVFLSISVCLLGLILWLILKCYFVEDRRNDR